MQIADCGWCFALKECSTSNSLTSESSCTLSPEEKTLECVQPSYYYYSGFKSCTLDLRYFIAWINILFLRDLKIFTPGLHNF